MSEANQIYIARLDMVITPYWNGQKYVDKETYNNAIEEAVKALENSCDIIAAKNNIRSLKK